MGLRKTDCFCEPEPKGLHSTTLICNTSNKKCAVKSKFVYSPVHPPSFTAFLPLHPPGALPVRAGQVLVLPNVLFFPPDVTPATPQTVTPSV